MCFNTSNWEWGKACQPNALHQPLMRKMYTILSLNLLKVTESSWWHAILLKLCISFKHVHFIWLSVQVWWWESTRGSKGWRLFFSYASPSHCSHWWKINLCDWSEDSGVFPLFPPAVRLKIEAIVRFSLTECVLHFQLASPFTSFYPKSPGRSFNKLLQEKGRDAGTFLPGTLCNPSVTHFLQSGLIKQPHTVLLMAQVKKPNV